MIVAESIGFSATHSISDILKTVPGFDVSHGSQNFATKAPVGTENQDIPGFIASMKASADAGHSPIAVHTLFPPSNMKPACEAAGIDRSKAATLGYQRRFCPDGPRRFCRRCPPH